MVSTVGFKHSANRWNETCPTLSRRQVKGQPSYLLAPVSGQSPVKGEVLVSLPYWCLSLFRSVVTLLALTIPLSSRLANPLVAVTNCLACSRGGRLSSEPLFEGIVHHGGDFAYFIGGARLFQKETENI